MVFDKTGTLTVETRRWQKAYYGANHEQALAYLAA